MACCRSIRAMLGFVVVLMFGGSVSTYTVPEVKFETLQPIGFKASIPDTGGATSFILHANINRPIKLNETEMLLGKTNKSTNGHLVVEFDIKLNANDIIYYWYYVIANRAGFVLYNFSWTVPELKLLERETFKIKPATTLGSLKPSSSNTVSVLFEDQFSGSAVDEENWIVEHRIPTYTKPRFLFNSFLKSRKNVYIKDGILVLQPIALLEDNQVRGTADLYPSCTSKVPEECHYEQVSTFLLPPVESAMLKSKRLFKYGKFEIRAKLPAGDWIIPIIQLARREAGNQTVDELWIAYTYGNKVYVPNYSFQDLGSNLLFAGEVTSDFEPLRNRKLLSLKSSRPFSDDFHTYALHRYPDKIQVFVDNELYGEQKRLDHNLFYPSFQDTEYELFIGVGVGGLIDFPEGITKPWLNNERNYMKKFFQARTDWLKTWNGDDTALKIDYVKVTAI